MAAAEQPLSQLPYTPSLDLTAMDRSVDPCEDFYQYVCGGWMEKNPVPADQSRWSVYAKMADENQRYLWGILERLKTSPAAELNASQAKMADYYAACMDEGATERLGLQALQPLLSRIEGLSSKQELPALLAALQLASNNERLFFYFSSSQDLADSSQLIAFAIGRRHQPAGPRLLPQERCEIAQDARSIWRPHRPHVRAQRQQPGASPGRRRTRVGHGDHAGPRHPEPCGQA